MHNPLSQRCLKALHDQNIKFDHLDVLKTLFVDHEYPEEKIDNYIDVLSTTKLETESSVIPFLKEVMVFLFFLQFRKEVTKKNLVKIIYLYEKLKLHPKAYDNSLVLSYIVLIGALIGENTSGMIFKTLPSGFVTLGTKEISPEGDQVIIADQVEIALNSLMIGVIKQDIELIRLSGKMLEALSNCIDRQGRLLVGLWSDPVIKNRNSLFSLLFLSLYIFNQISNNSSLNSFIEVQSKVLLHLPDNEVVSLGAYPFIVSFYVDQALNQHLHELKHEIYFSNESHAVYKDIGLIVDHLGEYSTYLTFSGINNSLGSILSQDIGVIAMGPHFLPLGDISKFGIYSLINTEREYSITFDKLDKATLIKGMTKVINADSNFENIQPSDTWLELEIQKHIDHLKLTVSLFGEPCKLPLFFAFFIKSTDTDMIGNHHVRPKSFDKYIGPAQKVVFKGVNKNFSIYPAFDDKMHLIPLEGKEHFWGADYLLACEISHFQKKYSWEFK